VDLPDQGRALRVENGSIWNSVSLPRAGEDSWTSYRVEVEVRPEKMWAEIDFHVQDDGRGGNAVTLFQSSDGKLDFEAVGLWSEAGAWKLWPVGQRQVLSPAGQWVRVRLDVGTDLANLYINGDPKPAATFYDFAFTRGGIRLATYKGSALFRNLRVTALPGAAVKPVLDDPWAEARRGEVLRDWMISPRQQKGYGEDRIPDEVAEDSVAWRKAPVDARGVVNLTSIFDPRNTAGVVYARTTLQAKAAGSRALRLTYTDNFILWCNGEKVFAGPPRQWFHPDREKYGNSRLIPDQFEVMIPVRVGENKLLVRSEATEPFGWAFWVRLLGSPQAKERPANRVVNERSTP
jgi:hypothetical protein